MSDEYPPPVAVKTPFLREKEQRNFGIAVLVLVLVIASLTLFHHFHDDRPKAELGELVDAADPVPIQHHRTVLVPGVSIEVGVTADLDDVPGDVAARRVQPPKGGSFLGVQVTGERSTSTTLPTFSGGTSTGVINAVQLSLVVDGFVYDLGSTGSSGSDLPIAGYLPVHGSPSSVTVKATWDGRSQSIDLRTGKRDAGDFAFLYRHRGMATASCGVGSLPAGWSTGSPAGCRYRVDRYAYANGHGWAAAGKTWLVLTLSVQGPTTLTRSAGGARIEFYYYGPGDHEPRIRLDGAAARDSTYTPGRGEASYTELVLCEVPTSTRSHAVTASLQSFYVARIAPAGTAYDHDVATSWSASIHD